MKKRMRLLKGLGLVLTAVIGLSLSGCESGNSGSGRGEFEDDQEETEAEATPTEAEPTESADPTPEPEPEVDYSSIYAPVVDEIDGMVRDGIDYDADYQYPLTGVMENISYGNSARLRYTIKDVSGDGVPELLIGEDMGIEGMQTSSYLYAVYSCKNGKITCVLDGWSRNSYRWVGDNSFYYLGSGGAAYTYAGYCHLSEDGTELLWDDFYFTAEVSGVIETFHNKTGVADVASSEKLDGAMADVVFAEPDVKECLDWDAFPSASAAGQKQLDTSIVGSWTLPSYVNMSYQGYEIFEDGTWLAVETPFTPMSTTEKGLSGTWKETGTDEYELIPTGEKSGKHVSISQAGDDLVEMTTEDSLAYLKSELSFPPELVGDWLFHKGSFIRFENDGSWQYYNDEEEWLFGGHYVSVSVPEGFNIRLHSGVGDVPDRAVAIGELRTDATGYRVINIHFENDVPDIAGATDELGKRL